MPGSLSIVVPTYNQASLLCECLRSLARQSFRDADVLVVDDGSEEDIAGVVAEEFPAARVLRLAQNKGFAAAANAGLQAADTEFVMLLNNDMTLETDCIERLMAAVEGGPFAMAAPLVLWKDEPETVYSAGDRVLINGRPESIGFREQRDTFRAETKVFGVSAGAAVYRRAIFERVGFLDESFIAYFEDADLCFRARLAGFEAACVPEAVAYHVGSASQQGKTWWRSRQCYRNHALLVLKNMPSSLILRYARPILLERFHQSRMLFSSARAEFGLLRALVEWARAKLEIVTLLPRVLHARRRILRDRVLKNDGLRQLLSR